MEKTSADDISIRIAKDYSEKICDAIRCYYKGKIITCHQKIENLVKLCANHVLAVSQLNTSRAFPGPFDLELQFYRARKEPEAQELKLKDMLHLPLALRGKSGNYRFSIPGVISLYLSNTSYGCWIEMGRPSEHDFYVSPMILDGTQKILNLAVMTRDQLRLNKGADDYVHCWIKLLVLMIATSYIVKERDRSFRSEYIVSQSIMLACKKLGYDGVAYYSKQVKDESLSLASINLALFVDFDRNKDWGRICEHIKIDEPMNFLFFKQLNAPATPHNYTLRILESVYLPMIEDGKRTYNYEDTEFCRFDNHLFTKWRDKEKTPWGNAIDDD